jgi:hypothetical protein
MGEIPEGTKDEKSSANEASYETFDEFLATLEPEVVELYNSHTEGLKSALDKERDDRRKLAESLKELQPKAEKGSELEATLSETLEKLEALEKQNELVQRKADFTELAIKPEIGCTNVKAAYALAVAEDLFDRYGKPEFDKLKEVAPELFKGSGGVTNAGSRASTTPDENDINYQIRKSAGIVD